MTKCYLGGPMRTRPNLNFEAFAEAARLLRAAGWEVVSPAEHDIAEGIDPGTWTEDAAKTAPLLLWDLGQIGDPSVDCVVMLPGWEDSTGCAVEMAFACALPKRIYAFSWNEGNPSGFHLSRLPDSPTEDDEPNAALAAAGDRYQDGETRIVNAETGGAKGQKLARFDLLPSGPMWLVAEHYGRGARKYADRNWELGYNWSLSYGAMQRHLHQFWSGESIDQETGGHHLSAAVFHCLAMMEFEVTHPDLDDRPLHRSGV